MSTAHKIMYNIPNMLSYFRIAVIPVMFLLFYFDGPVTAWINLFFFTLAAASDYFDGEIARKTGQTTLLGKFLDSSTDKMLMGAVLMLLVAFDRLTGFWIFLAIVIFLREILVAGLREFMAMENVIVPISKLGKWKMTVQLIASGFLIVGIYGESLLLYSFTIGKALFLLATVLTVWSGWIYLKEGIKAMQGLDNNKPE